MWFFKARLWFYSLFQKKYAKDFSPIDAVKQRQTGVELAASKSKLKKCKRKEKYLQKVRYILNSEYGRNELLDLIVNKSNLIHRRCYLNVASIFESLLSWERYWYGHYVGDDGCVWARQDELLKLLTEELASKYPEYRWFYHKEGVRNFGLFLGNWCYEVGFLLEGTKYDPDGFDEDYILVE